MANTVVYWARGRLPNDETSFKMIVGRCATTKRVSLPAGTRPQSEVFILRKVGKSRVVLDILHADIVDL